MKVLLTGAAGQLGRELTATAPDGIELIGLDHNDLDICDTAAVDSVVGRERPQWIINTAAYTSVDRAEHEPDRAHAVNAEAVGTLAAAARNCRARLLQISTDYVFDGVSPVPYTPDDQPRPLNVYGASKLGGERAATGRLGDMALIVRTSWLYSAHGRNFVNSMLGLLASRERLEVVFDQVGSPTSARGLAAALWAALAQELHGIWHWCDAGVASWYDFAVAVQRGGLERGLLRGCVPIEPIRGPLPGRPAARPAYSVLDAGPLARRLGCRRQHWSARLAEVLVELGDGAD